MPLPKTVLLLLSGGLDSTVLLHDLIAQKVGVGAILFDYGQKHSKELDLARAHCHATQVGHRTIRLDRVFTNSKLVDGKGSVIVPNRNMTFLSIAASIAACSGIESVAIACNLDDKQTFLDCRPAFLNCMNEALSLAGTGVEICAPYLSMTKKEIVRRGRKLGVDVEATWSCYEGGIAPCQTCPACEKRNAALCA